MGMISSILVFQLGQARVWFAMSRDGLLPAAFSHVHNRFRTPDVATWVAGVFVAIPAGIFDIGTLADLSNIGTLFAFILVSIAVLILRKRQSVDSVDTHRVGDLLLRSDGKPNRGKLASLLCLAANRIVRVSLLWPEAQ
jgi:amino acid transporter